MARGLGRFAVDRGKAKVLIGAISHLRAFSHTSPTDHRFRDQVREFVPRRETGAGRLSGRLPSAPFRFEVLLKEPDFIGLHQGSLHRASADGGDGEQLCDDEL